MMYVFSLIQVLYETSYALERRSNLLQVYHSSDHVASLCLGYINRSALEFTQPLLISHIETLCRGRQSWFPVVATD